MNESNKLSNSASAQQALLLQLLVRAKSLGVTSFEARCKGIYHPAGRIQELRAQGHNIKTEWTQITDTAGFNRRVARYILISLANGGHAA